MLIGPTQKFSPPTLPREEAGIRGILEYLTGLEHSIRNYTASVTAGSIGMIGVRGLSSSGVSAQNFTQRISLSNVATGRWVFANPEPNVSYMLWIQGTVPASTILTGIERGLTFMIVTCATGVSGLAADCLLLR